MQSNSRIFVIQHIEGFVHNLIRISYSAMKLKYNVNPAEHFDYYVEWVINEILNTNYNVKVIHHYRNDEYKCIYTEDKIQILDVFKSCTSYADMLAVSGCEVKTLINGSDLFITRRITYKHFI